MKLSIVTTLYCSAPYIEEFAKRAHAAGEAFAGADFEIIMVNDGSPDDSLKRALALCDQYTNLVVVDLSRNFGHHKAIMTGLAFAKGDLVFLIDSDLEEDPAWLAALHDRMTQSSADLVYGVQLKRKGRAFERISGDLYYRFFEAMTDLRMPRNLTTARLMSKRFVQALLDHREREIFFAGLSHITGFKQETLPVAKASTSPTTYNLRRKIALAVNSITAFSTKPLIFIFYVGAAVSVIAFLAILAVLMNWMFRAEPPNGWTSLIASIWFIGGLMISFLGIVGIYISKLFSEVKQRPYTIVRGVHGGGENG